MGQDYKAQKKNHDVLCYIKEFEFNPESHGKTLKGFLSKETTQLELLVNKSILVSD